jgi:hypothetical protein
MPTRRCEPIEYGSLGGGFVQMERLRVEFSSKTLYVVRGDLNFFTLKTHAQA